MAVLRAALDTVWLGTLTARTRSWKTVRALLMLHHVVHHSAFVSDRTCWSSSYGRTTVKREGLKNCSGNVCGAGAGNQP